MQAIRGYSRGALQLFARRANSHPSIQVPFQVHQIHTKRAPYSGPPSYATITRRLSDQPNPITFFNTKKQTQFDIHDVDARDIDVLLTDVTDRILRSEITDIVGIPYLEKASKDQTDKVVETCEGFIYGRHRTILPCVVCLEDQARWVFFVVDSSAPATYLSEPTAEAFGIEYSPAAVTIAGYRHQAYVSPRGSHFAEINLLGADFCNISGLNYWTNHNKGTVTFYFGNQWVVNKAG
jgi:hypothetical protein